MIMIHWILDAVMWVMVKILSIIPGKDSEPYSD